MDQAFSNYLSNKKPRIKSFLKALPHLELSEKGLQNVAKKFGVTADMIQQIAEELKN